MDSEAPPTTPDAPAPDPILTRIARLGADSRSAIALRNAGEALRTHVTSGRRGLAVCAAARGTGVSFVTASLGLTLADTGIRTLLIDANLRGPMLTELVPPRDPPTFGLLSYLRGEVESPSQLVETDVAPNLSAIYAGGTAEDVHDLFDTDRFEEVMTYALRTYDLTLIDTPPANRCAETRRIAAVAGYAVIVARRNVTMAEDLGQLVKDLRLDRTDVIGSIFNEG
jgi:protein-tyrosine kinase